MAVGTCGVHCRVYFGKCKRLLFEIEVLLYVRAVVATDIRPLIDVVEEPPQRLGKTRSITFRHQYRFISLTENIGNVAMGSRYDWHAECRHFYDPNGCTALGIAVAGGNTGRQENVMSRGNLDQCCVVLKTCEFNVILQVVVGDRGPNRVSGIA